MKHAYITLAGGCFWSMEMLFRSIPGVLDVTCGYANGRGRELASYEAVCSGITGFREAVQVIYDPERVSLCHLLFVFFAAVDVTVFSRQGFDIGPQYQTGVYYAEEVCPTDIERIFALERAGAQEFYVECKPLKNFFPAEEYHQQYLVKHPDGYCHISPEKSRRIAAFPFADAQYTKPAKKLLEA